MDKEKKESALRTAENFVKKSEIEKAFILGYMVRRMQLREPETELTEEPGLAMK